jgi:hypothetical protein
MRFDRFQDFVAVWFLWLGLQVIGAMFGMIFGEACGQLIAQVFTLSAAHFAAFLIFEIVVWIPRRVLFQRLFFDPAWKAMTQLIWLVTEILMWSIWSHVLQISTTPHLTEGAAFGSVIGAALWFLLWCAQQAPRNRWWFLIASLYALGGVIIGISVATIAFTLGDEVHRILSVTVHPLVAEAGMGAIIGLGVGCLTGGVIAHQRITLAPSTVHR